jgi:hypothetical protein
VISSPGVQASVTDGNGAAFSKAISKFDSDGRETSAQESPECNRGSMIALYFKRLKQVAD